MSAALRPDGQPVAVGGVSIVSPGLRGTVEVLAAGAAGLRSADSARGVLVDALRASGLREQETIVIRDHALEATAAAGGVSRGRTSLGEPGLSVTVPGPGTGLGQVLLAIDEAGLASWVLPDDVPAAESVSRGGSRRTYTVPIDIAKTAPHTGQRGLIAVVGKKVLKVLAFKLLAEVSAELASRFAAHWEEQRHPHRLRPFGPDDYRSPDAPSLTAAGLAAFGGGPVLLFIHGEMNLSHTGFGQLPRDLLGRLRERYQGRVLAFDHPTVSVTPTGNATWLAGVVRTTGLTVDVVAHSRGGLVARVLAEQPESAGLDRGSLTVRRLIMAGTPNQGTALADAARLGHLVDRVTDLLDFVPDTGVVEVLNIVISVVKQIAVGAYSGLDGVTAMKPAGPWLKALNSEHPTTTAYHAISSNYEPAEGAPLGRLTRDRVTDLVFKNTGNDLIVPEAGVHGRNGASAFPIAGPLTLTAGQSVDHFGYWGCPPVQEKLEGWLG